MKARSAKNKGARFQKWVKEQLHKYWPLLQDNDVKTAVMGETGRDIFLSPMAESEIPFDIECKNVERLNLWDSIKQAEENTGEGRIPLLIFKRNFSKAYAVLELSELLKLTTQRTSEE